MGRQVWGTYSVKDHCDPNAFIADVLLYDRLVQRSESPETVDLSRRERLALVGPASKRYQDFHSVPLVIPVPPDDEERKRWEDAGWQPDRLDNLLETV
jgi:hypothetical protein